MRVEKVRPALGGLVADHRPGDLLAPKGQRAGVARLLAHPLHFVPQAFEAGLLVTAAGELCKQAMQSYGDLPTGRTGIPECPTGLTGPGTLCGMCFAQLRVQLWLLPPEQE
jgi:hypothetical protein